MQLKSKRVNGEKTESLTLTKTETQLLNRAADLISDVASHSTGDLKEVANDSVVDIAALLLLLKTLPKEEPAKT